MESKTRHDLRHPLATISMMASAIASFGDQIGADTIDSYRDQVLLERDQLKEVMAQHGLSLSLGQLEESLAEFCANPTPEAARSLDRTCHDLIAQLMGEDRDGS